MSSFAELFRQAVWFHQQGNLGQAETSYRQALRLDPNNAQAHARLGETLQAARRWQEAFDCFQEAIRLDPLLADAHNNLGGILAVHRHYTEAIQRFQQTLRLDPNHALASKNLAKVYSNLGFIHYEQGEYADAEEAFRQALSISPHDANMRYNLGTAFVEQGKVTGAGECFRQTLAIDPGHKMALWNWSLLRLTQGDFEGGWPGYELRWAKLGKVPRSFEQPRWDGSPLAGKTILVYAEQGLGDTLQFVRFLPLVQRRGGKVIFECQGALFHLLTGIAGVDQLISAGSPLPWFDVHIPLLSLPGILETTLDNIPVPVPYLSADPGLIDRWGQEIRDRAVAVGSPLNIGIVWQGSLDQKNDRRSIPLNYFEGLARVPGVRLVSLQAGHACRQLAEVSFPIIDLGSKFNWWSLADLAAALRNVDLLVTVDTSVPHLAGAMGVPVWVALPVVADWRWLLDRQDSPWYPTMRLFRQTRSGEWSDVFERIAAELSGLIV